MNGDALLYVGVACAVALGLAVTWLTRVFAIRHDLVSVPNPIVPQHTRPVAHLGGVAIAFATGLTLLIVAWLSGGWASVSVGSLALWRVAIGAGAFLLLGCVDDLTPLSARRKLALQFLIAIAAAGIGVRYSFVDFALVDFALSVAWIVILVNCVNVADVCDGLVSGIMFITITWWALVDPSAALVALVLAGACFGFLVFNFPPASIFLGNAGSYLLGYALAALFLTSPRHPGYLLRPAQMALFAAPFLFEMFLLVIERRRKGLAWWQGSADHFSLRLQAAGFSRLQTDGVAWAATALCCGAAYALDLLDWHQRTTLIAVILLVAFVCWRQILRLNVPVPEQEDRSQSERKLRVLWIHQNFVSARQPGNSRPVHIIAAFLARGWSVDVITGQAGYLDDEPPIRHTRVVVEQEGGLTIHRLSHAGGLGNRGLSWIAFFFAALRRVRTIGAVDVVYASTPPPLQMLLAAIVSVRWHAPMVTEVRDLWPAFLVRLNLVRSRAIVFGLEWLESLAYRYGRRCISVSPAFSDYLISMGVRPDTIAIAPTGASVIPTAQEEKPGIPWRAQQGIERKFLVLYAGSFNEAYGLETMLAASQIVAAARSDVVWLFAGNGRRRSDIEVAVGRFEYVRYLGNLSKDDLAAVFDAADVGIVSLVDEPLLDLVVPGKLFDYLAAGVPVISTKDGVGGAIIRLANAGIVLPEYSAGQLADAVLQCAGPLRDTLKLTGHCGRRWVFENIPSAMTAWRVANMVVDAHRDGQHTSRLYGFVAANLGAACDVLTRRSHRAVRQLLRLDLSRLAQDRLEQWLDESRRDCSGREVKALELPSLLSRWGKPVTQPATESEPTTERMNRRRLGKPHRLTSGACPGLDGKRPNMLTIDVEDWYHSLDPDPDRWGRYEDRVEFATRQVLDILTATATTATFFVLGHVAEHHHELVREIHNRGHEVASHGSHHRFIYRQTEREFKDDVLRSVDVLSSITGESVRGYRAPYFSITKQSLWARAILRELDIEYDSSVYPVLNHRYGIPDAPRLPHRTEEGLLEFPLSCYPLRRFNIPCGGGVYFRALPYSATRWLFRRMQGRGEPIVFYLHPWELDPEQPRFKEAPVTLRSRHYWKLHRTADAFSRLLRDFSFRSIREALPAYAAK